MLAYQTVLLLCSRNHVRLWSSMFRLFLMSSFFNWFHLHHESFLALCWVAVCCYISSRQNATPFWFQNASVVDHPQCRTSGVGQNGGAALGSWMQKKRIRFGQIIIISIHLHFTETALACLRIVVRLRHWKIFKAFKSFTERWGWCHMRSL